MGQGMARRCKLSSQQPQRFDVKEAMTSRLRFLLLFQSLMTSHLFSYATAVPRLICGPNGLLGFTNINVNETDPVGTVVIEIQPQAVLPWFLKYEESNEHDNSRIQNALISAVEFQSPTGVSSGYLCAANRNTNTDCSIRIAKTLDAEYLYGLGNNPSKFISPRQRFFTMVFSLCCCNTHVYPVYLNVDLKNEFSPKFPNTDVQVSFGMSEMAAGFVMYDITSNNQPTDEDVGLDGQLGNLVLDDTSGSDSVCRLATNVKGTTLVLNRSVTCYDFESVDSLRCRVKVSDQLGKGASGFFVFHLSPSDKEVVCANMITKPTTTTTTTTPTTTTPTTTTTTLKIGKDTDTSNGKATTTIKTTPTNATTTTTNITPSVNATINQTTDTSTLKIGKDTDTSNGKATTTIKTTPTNATTTTTNITQSVNATINQTTDTSTPALKIGKDTDTSNGKASSSTSAQKRNLAIGLPVAIATIGIVLAAVVVSRRRSKGKTDGTAAMSSGTSKQLSDPAEESTVPFGGPAQAAPVTTEDMTVSDMDEKLSKSGNTGLFGGPVQTTPVTTEDMTVSNMDDSELSESEITEMPSVSSAP